jgi:FkbM family methyltransferase
MRSVLRHPWIEPSVARALRARLTTSPVRFFVRDAQGHGVFPYTVKATGKRMLLEHGTPDIAAFDQAYYSNQFTPTAHATQALHSLGHPLTALDLGANIGMFSVWLASTFPVAKIIAVEPLPRNAGQLRANLQAAIPDVRTEVVEAAATTHDGELTFGGGDFTTGRIGGGGDGAVTVKARDAFALAEGVDLLKIDIEGAEWDLVADPRFARLTNPVVMFEHHPHGAPGDPATVAANALADAGYVVEHAEEHADGTGVVWGVRAPAT